MKITSLGQVLEGRKKVLMRVAMLCIALLKACLFHILD